MYLHEVEAAAGVSIVKWAKRCAVSTETLLRRTRKEREVGRHSASLYGWHSLRASFVVAALTAGVPLEVVRRIVGHSTADMTLEYFNPTKRIMAETVRRRLAGSAIAGGASKTGVGARGASRLLGARADAPDASAGVASRLAAIVANMSAAEREQLKALLG